MREENRAAREETIEQAAYRLLAIRGYGGSSMLAIAKEAKASNETLYRWYGDKRGLFRRLVERNAAVTKAALEEALADKADPLASLEAIAPVLLAMLLGERAIALNRAAAADESGELGAAITEAGRGAIAPLLQSLIRRALASDALSAPSAATATEWLLGLLIGDQQIRRVIGALPPLAPKAIQARAATALAAFRQLCGA